jgi:aspartate/methionine/tyrosine aminotransferase/methylase of polypeptide subunit release factors
MTSIKDKASAFLIACEASPESRRAKLCELESGLRSEQDRTRWLAICHDLRQRGENNRGQGSVRIVRFRIQTSSVEDHLDLLLTPSVFSPEEWSYTFLEGLLRRPKEDYLDRRAIELGTGSGWVSLALLRHTPLEFVTGLDLNPDAVQIARINAYLNSYTEDGKPRRNEQGRLLCEAFKAQQADLLSPIRARGETADLVIGCIPQVLSTEQDLSLIKEASDEQRLHDLSNYFVQQGVEEDRFGLGLLARALEESIDVLKPGGRVILNVATRPGLETIGKMFGRRGFEDHTLWQRRVQQASDTDIQSLVELEALTGNRFEFYVDRHSRRPIPAATAQALIRSGRHVWHDILVVEARLLFERDLKPFMTTIRDELGYEDFLRRLDLSALSAEQLSFLRPLARRFCDRQAVAQQRSWSQGLEKSACGTAGSARVVPYTHEAGSKRLRTLIANYVRHYHDLDLGLPSESHGNRVFIAPNREALVEGLLLSLCEKGAQVVVSEEVHLLFARIFEKAGVQAIVANDDLSDIRHLAEVLSPKLVLVSVDPVSGRYGAELDELAKLCADRGIALVVDGSAEFDISSRAPANRLLKYAARRGLGRGFLIVVGLIRNRVYPDLQPGILLGAWEDLLDALIGFAEASYSRNGTFTEHYYCQLFEDVLSFQLVRPDEKTRGSRYLHGAIPSLSTRMKRVLALPAFAPGPKVSQGHPAVIRLDYGENELPIPDELVKGILLGFTNLLTDVSEQDLQETLALTAKQLLNYQFDPQAIVLGAGAFPLLYDTCLGFRGSSSKRLRVGVPRAHYGYVLPIFELAGMDIVILETLQEDAWLMTREVLDEVEPLDVLWLNNPVNPVGVRYPRALLGEIADYALEHGTRILCDEIFALLPLGEQAESAVKGGGLLDLESYQEKPGLRKLVTVFSGLSKAFAAGGLRVGFGFYGDQELAGRVRQLRTVPVSRHALLATQILFRGFRADPSTNEARERVLESLTKMRQQLTVRRQGLVELLGRYGLTVAAGDPAGLFVLADIRPLLGRRVKRPNGRTILIGDEDSLHEILLGDWGLRINHGRWSGTPGWARICFSIDEPVFEEALSRLAVFFEAIQ